MNSDFLKKLERLREKIPETLRRLPGIAKVEGLRFIHDNFDKQGFEERDGVVKKWKSRKNASRKNLGRAVTVAGERKGRNLLIATGAMRRSWDADSSAGIDSTTFASSLPYAGVHNDGLEAGRPPGFMMPERKMIGDSEALFGRIEQKFDKLVDKEMN